MPRLTFWGQLHRNPLSRVTRATVVAMVLMGAGSISSASAACTDENLVPAQLGIQTARDSVACVINEERAAAGLGPLTVSVNLQQAGQRHSKAMNKRNFFGHGATMSRVRRAGYMAGASSWGFGEVIGWGKGRAGTPRSIVSSWMRSPPHRGALLGRGFQELGVGVVKGSPLSRKRRVQSAIYTVDLGYRR